MNVSDRIIDLNNFFPFRNAEDGLQCSALKLGKCVKYNSGEPVLLSGSPAKHCGLIVEGQAVAFKTDEHGRRYQLCLDEGCFIGLESIRENSSYSAKIVAVSDLEVFFWNADGISRLMSEFPSFGQALHMLDEGRVYQEQWLIPETDITDPVLCSQPANWLSAAGPVLGILLVLFICLWTFSLLIRRYAVAWLLVFAALIAAGSLLYSVVSKHCNKRLILTTKNFILIPGSNGSEMAVSRLYGFQSMVLRQNYFQRLVDVGSISIRTEDEVLLTPLISHPAQTAALIRFFAERSSKGRFVPLRLSENPKKKLAYEQTKRPADRVPDQVPDHVTGSAGFRTIEFHAHWALLVKMIIKPLLLLIAACCVMYFSEYFPYRFAVRKGALLAVIAAIAGMAYRFFTWKNHRFFIEEDRIRDYRRKPLTSEDQNMAMNHKIQSVRFQKQGLFQNLLNYGTVYILAGEGELSFDYVSDPQNVQQQIMDNCARFESVKRQSEETRQRAYIDELIADIRQETNRTL